MARRDADVPGRLPAGRRALPGDQFVSDGLRQEGDRWPASATVTAHATDVPAEVVVDRVALDGQDVRVHGRAEQLDRRAFGVTGSRGMVGRYLDLDFDVRRHG